MNRGLKHYTKQLTQEVGGASCSVNLNKEDANLHISIPLIKTVGLDPIDLSLIFNLQDFNNDSNNYLFGKGSKLNLFTRYTDTTSKITLLNADGSSDEYLSTKNFYNAETQLTINKVQYTSSQYIYQVKDKYGNQRDFYNGVNYPKQIKMKSGAIITTDFQTTQPYLSNGKGDKVQFTVVNGLTTKLTYLHDNVEVYRTEIEYSNNRIYKVKYYNGETLMSSLCLSYGGYGFELVDEISGYRIKYIFSGSRVLNIIPGYDSSYSNSPSTSISYEDNKTTVTNYKGEKLYYYFDSCQLPLFEMDDKGNVIETEYDSETKALLAKNEPINAKDNSTNILPSRNINIFDKESISIVSTTVSDPNFSSILGDSIYKVTGNTTGANRLSYRLNVSGIATDNITAVVFGKQLTNYSSSNFVKVTLRAGSYDSDTDYFKKETIDNQFDLLTLGVTAERSYDFIDLDFVIYGNTSIELGGIQIIKKDFGSFFKYDEFGNEIGTHNNGAESNLEYNEYNLMSTTISRDSSLNKFEYDQYGNMISYATSYGVTVENQYDENRPSNLLSTTKMNCERSKILKTEKQYTNDGRFVSKEKDELGNETNFDLYDSFGRIRKITNALSTAMEFDYFDDGTLKKIIMSKDNENSHVNYLYDEKKRLISISLSNNSIYEFSYDDFNNLSIIKLNGRTLYEYTYDFMTGNILTSKYCQNGDGYQFVYNSNDSSLIDSIYYIHKDGTIEYKYGYEYDNQKRISRVYDNYGDIIYDYTYDNDGNVTTITGEYIQIKKKHDNLGNITIKSNNVNGKKVYTSYDTVRRSKGTHPFSLTKATSGFIGIFDKDSNIYSGKNCINSINHNYTYNPLSTSRDGVINYVNVNENNLLSYNLDYVGMILECGCVQFWFKPDATSVGPDYMECLFSSKNSNGTGSIELMAEGGRLNLFVVDDSGVEHHLISANHSIKYGEWNFLSLNFINRNDGATYDDITEYHFILNEEKQSYIKKNPGIRVTLGNNPIYNIGHKYNGINTSHCFSGKIAALRIMPRNYSSISEIYNYYFLSKKYLLENSLKDEGNEVVEFSQTNLFTTNSIIQNQFEIYPLQNHVESLNGLQPKKFDLRKISSMDKDRTFNFNNKIKRYAYVADGSKLVYNFDQTTDGTIAMRVYFEELKDIQYVFQGKDSDGNTIGLFRDSRGKIGVEINGEEIYTDFVVDSMEWTNIAVSFSEAIVSDSETESNCLNLRIYVNNEYCLLNLEKSFSYKLLDFSIGRMMDDITENTSFGFYYNCHPLFGQIEMLCASKTFCEDATIMTLFDEMKGITKLNEFDEFGMLQKTDLHILGNSLLSNCFEYKTRNNDNRYLSNLINKEKITLKTNILSTRSYDYDALGRMIKVDDSYFGSHNYQYDYRGFLVKADGVEYKYDNNGNIINAGNKTFLYDNTIKDLLVKVDDKIIEYDQTNPFIIKSYNGNTYDFEGKRLKKISNANGVYNYVYDDKGLRTYKYKNGESWIYQYDDDKLVYQLHNNIRLDFIYDENNMLYGFIKDNSEKYFYIRDVTKNILGIIDNEGQIVVKYEYDPFGLCTSVTGPLASSIGVINPFRYKGYYFDFESNLYYCKSRYYVPEWGRWLTCDSAEFLDIENINGLNLFCYCQNNPITCFDEDGDLPKWAKTLIVAAAGVVAVAGIVAVTVASGGLAAPVLIGAGMGAITGAASSSVMQLMTEGKIDVSKVVVDATIGGVCGAFGASTLGKIGMTIAGSITGATSSIATDWVEDKEIDVGAALGSAFVGGTLAFAAGPAKQFATKNQSSSVKQVLNKISKSEGHWKKGLTKIYNNKLNGISKQVISTIKNGLAQDFGINCISFVMTAYF